MILQVIRKWFAERAPATGRWRLLFIPKGGERIDLGSFEGHHDAALDEAQTRMVNYVFRQGLSTPLIGSVGIEPEP